KAREMRHIHEEIGADLIRYRPESGKIPMARIAGAASDDELWLVLLGEPRHRVHVDTVVVWPNPVGDRLEPAAGEIDMRAMRQMAARGEIESHEGITRLQQSEKHGLVRLAAGIRLHIGKFAVEETGDTLDSQVFGDIDELAAAVIAPARIALRIFVGQNRSLRFEDGFRDDVLGSDQLDFMALAAEF